MKPGANERLINIYYALVTMAAGDRVRVSYEDKEVEGILMPRPELLEKGFIVVKLATGYNLSIDEKKVKEITVVEEYQVPKAEKKEIKKTKGLPVIPILSTGGTISSKIDYRTGGVYAKYSAEEFVQMCPKLSELANIKAAAIMQVMSEDMHHTHWKDMAERIAKELNGEAEGIVITHGTDTLHYTSAALSFFLQGLHKPVVLTASQRSIDRGSSDAFQNLTTSVAGAAQSKIAEVMICMHGSTNDDYGLLLRGTKVRKMHNTRRDAFRPINDFPLAKIFPDGKIEYLNNFKESKTGEITLATHFEPKVALVLVHPGFDPKIIDYYLDNGYKGIVFAGYALGHLPISDEKYSLLPSLKRAMKAGIPVVITSQTLYGRTHPYVYTNLRRLSIEAKCIFGREMLPEVAYVKLGWVLGKTNDFDEVKKLMQTNIAGEITERSLPKTFLA